MVIKQFYLILVQILLATAILNVLCHESAACDNEDKGMYNVTTVC